MKKLFCILSFASATLVAATSASAYNQICTMDVNEWGNPSLCSCPDEQTYSAISGLCGNFFGEDRTYLSLVAPYETIEECEKANEDVLFNCYHVLNFSPNGIGDIMFTDIINRMTYSIDWDTRTVEIVLDQFGEFTGTLEMTISADESILRDSDSNDWILDGPNSVYSAPSIHPAR